MSGSNPIDRTSETGGIHLSNQRRPDGTRKSIYDSRTRRRPTSDIDTIVLHQTDIPRGDRRRSRVDGNDYMITHFLVLGDGTCVQLRPLTMRLNNVRSWRGVHIEFMGDFYDVNGRNGIEVPGVAQILEGRALINYIRNHREIRGQIRYVIAHYQLSSMHRENCCGPYIWYNVGRWVTDPARGLGLSCFIPRPRGCLRIPPAWIEPRFQIPPPASSATPPRSSRVGRPRPGRLALRPDGVLSSFRKPGPLGTDYS